LEKLAPFAIINDPNKNSSRDLELLHGNELIVHSILNCIFIDIDKSMKIYAFDAYFSYSNLIIKKNLKKRRKPDIYLINYNKEIAIIIEVKFDKETK